MQPQIIIKKVQVFSEEAKWTFDLQNAADRKSFFPRVIIRQIDIDRAIDPVVATQAKLFTPTFSYVFEPLARNILYPFYVYGSDNE